MQAAKTVPVRDTECAFSGIGDGRVRFCEGFSGVQTFHREGKNTLGQLGCWTPRNLFSFWYDCGPHGIDAAPKENHKKKQRKSTLHAIMNAHTFCAKDTLSLITTFSNAFPERWGSSSQSAFKIKVLTGISLVLHMRGKSEGIGVRKQLWVGKTNSLHLDPPDILQ